MPQMAPINWLVLFVYFSLTLLIFTTLNYYSFSYQSKSLGEKPSKPVIKWKW
uniref:ATP synthase complex subunit 8 n=1 Tax=Papunya picta TaxID=2546579 RepID=A0A6H0N1T5_9CUCU|nr:ATP synthase F0 subunit 8 [Papunya picta]